MEKIKFKDLSLILKATFILIWAVFISFVCSIIFDIISIFGGNY